MRSIFSEKRHFENQFSFNSNAAILFSEDPDSFLEKTMKCAENARSQFMNLPIDCPYRFDKLMPIPDDVKALLEDMSVLL